MEIKLDIPPREAEAVERLLACLLARYTSDLSSIALSGAVRVRQALAKAISEQQRGQA